MVHEHPEPEPARYNQLHRQTGGLSQKMLVQTLRRLEHNGRAERTVYPVGATEGRLL